MSSMNPAIILYVRPLKISAMSFWNETLAFWSPNGIRRQEYWPPCVTKLVLSLLSGWIGICQKAPAKSELIKAIKALGLK